jgi:hypothetical protein
LMSRRQAKQFLSTRLIAQVYNHSETKPYFIESCFQEALTQPDKKQNQD